MKTTCYQHRIRQINKTTDIFETDPRTEDNFVQHFVRVKYFRSLREGRIVK